MGACRRAVLILYGQNNILFVCQLMSVKSGRRTANLQTRESFVFGAKRNFQIKMDYFKGFYFCNPGNRRTISRRIGMELLLDS